MGGKLMTDDEECAEIVFYGLSTCMWCKKTKAFLDEKKIDYVHYFVNEMEGDEKETIRAQVCELNPKMTFPTVKIGDRIILGHHPDELEEALAACQQKMK
jgi:glutaredoxin-like protein NrdH